MRKRRNSETAKVKERIQALLRQIVIKRDGGCVLRIYQQSGQCGGYTESGNLVLQADHLITRGKNIGYAEPDLVVCLCKRHHIFWKKQYGDLYWEFMEKIIGPARWQKLKKAEADQKIYEMTAYDWGKTELYLKEIKGNP